MIRTIIRPAIACIVLGFAAAIWVYDNTLRSEFRVLESAGSARLGEASNRMRLQIDALRAQTNFFATSPHLARNIEGADFESVTENLKDYALTYGATRIDLFDAKGRTLATSAFEPRMSHAKLVHAAINGRLGFEQDRTDINRFFRFSRGVKGRDGEIIAALVVTADVEALEFEWPVTPEVIVFLNEEKLAFSSNRNSLVLVPQTANGTETSFVVKPNGKAAGFQTYMIAPPNEAAREAIIIERYVPHFDLTSEIFLETASARDTALVRALLALAVAAVIGLVAAIAAQQRLRLATEARYSATLEARVEERTKELRNAQDELVEASKLAALGRLSAGVSHEINQPLGAILNFSDNAKKFLNKDLPDKAGENLTLISGQVERIKRIISNLRAFARQEAATTELIDFKEVIQAVVTSTQDMMEEAKIEIRTDLPDQDIGVIAGRVRLEQVVLNLLSNAKDAMANSDLKRIYVTLTRDPVNARLVVQDTGPGISDPTRVFEPFYTTKELGASKGLGMGLALSHGLITRFGGTLTCQNQFQGAEFTITLPIAQPAE
ncbi:MAG: ATP-binding protein [Pseudomonadota bacterium]|nr:ATP-binding protein [Pseudomonadota bacterium]